MSITPWPIVLLADYKYMILLGKRIIKTTKLNGILNNGDKFFVGIIVRPDFKETISKIGFSGDLSHGDSILPSSNFGPVSSSNADGKYIKQKNLPMETAYRQREWHWKQWNGRGQTIDRTEIVDVPYKRYPRVFVEPQSIEFTVCRLNTGQFVIISPLLEFSQSHSQKIINVVNLFLEIFGECQFFTKDLDCMIKVPLKKLNWRILPAGKMPWQQLKKEIDPILNKAPEGNRPVIINRLENIVTYEPKFAAVGEGGFRGYIVLGFEDKKIFTLESIFYGNATYVFGDDWARLSKKTKAEILDEKSQKDRIIHAKNWPDRISALLK